MKDLTNNFTINKWSEEDLMEASRRDLNEDPSKTEEDLKTIKNWISKSPHLHTIKQDDQFLITFMRACKFSLEKTKEKLESFFTVRGGLPVWYDNWDPRLPEIKRIVSAGLAIPLPGYDKQGRRVVVMRIGLHDPETMKKDDIFKTTTMMIESALAGDNQAVIRGIVLVQDLEGMALSKTVGMTPALMKRASTVQEAMPTRPKAIHILNFPSFMESIYKMSTSFLKQKMRERHHVHGVGDFTGIQEELGLEVLPQEYGGTNSSLAELTEFWAGEMERRRDWLIEQPRYKTDEARRPGKPKSHSDIFGIEGSFRKLEID